MEFPQVIAVCPGPTFANWVKSNTTPAVLLVGCSTVSHYIRPHVYAIGDIIHEPDIPKYRCHVVAATRLKGTTPTIDSKVAEWWCDEIPHGCSSGGMCLSIAAFMSPCLIGLVGFDAGYHDSDHIVQLMKLVDYWRLRNREFVSLTPNSMLEVNTDVPIQEQE
jgi:hypothetical protein